MMRLIFLVSMFIYCCRLISATDYGRVSYSAETYPTKSSSSNNSPISQLSQSSMPDTSHKIATKDGYTAGQVVQAAVQTKHQIEFRDVPITGHVVPTTIEVGANSVPLNILFRSASSSLNIQQAHDSAQGSVQESSSEDEPHRLIHSVRKPIIQEIHEVITPFRKITQEIQPVQEKILTIVARGKDGQSVADFAENIFETKSKSSSNSVSKQISSSYGASNDDTGVATTTGSRTKVSY